MIQCVSDVYWAMIEIRECIAATIYFEKFLLRSHATIGDGGAGGERGNCALSSTEGHSKSSLQGVTVVRP